MIVRYALLLGLPLLSLAAAGPVWSQATPVQASQASAWPECRPGQIRVLLLGTYHMANPGLDDSNIAADDVLSARRQAELDTLVGRLASYAPDRVMVEWPYGTGRTRADSAYAAYLAAGGRTASREEVQQIGFRLARVLGHDRVYPVDYSQPLDNAALRAYAEGGGRTIHTMDYRQLIPPRLLADADSLLRASTLTEFLQWMNDDVALRGNHFGMYMHLGAGEGEVYPGPDMIEGWYGRNLRIAHHMLRSVEPGDERVLLLVGAGHVRVLRHILDEAPHFCPESPLPYLAGED